jgi:hypothetical protein
MSVVAKHRARKASAQNDSAPFAAIHRWSNESTPRTFARQEKFAMIGISIHKADTLSTYDFSGGMCL